MMYIMLLFIITSTVKRTEYRLKCFLRAYLNVRRRPECQLEGLPNTDSGHLVPRKMRREGFGLLVSVQISKSEYIKNMTLSEGGTSVYGNCRAYYGTKKSSDSPLRHLWLEGQEAKGWELHPSCRGSCICIVCSGCTPGVKAHYVTQSVQYVDLFYKLTESGMPSFSMELPHQVPKSGLWRRYFSRSISTPYPTSTTDTNERCRRNHELS